MLRIRFFVVLAALFARIAFAGGIAWQTTLDGALADAKTRHVPVFIAVNMDGERANDEMVNVTYKNARILELAAKCSCVFSSVDDHDGDKACHRCGGPVTCVQHQAIEKQVRAKYLKTAGTGYVAPQHVFLDADGNVLLSVSYRVSPGELEWCFVSALKTLDEKFDWKLADDAIPPRRLVKGGMADLGSETTMKAPTKKEVDEILAELMKSKHVFEKIDLLAKLLRSPEKRAIEFFENLLSGKLGNREDGLIDLLKSFGRYSPPEYALIVTPFLEDDRPKVKSQAIVTLELLANPKALPALQKAWKKDKEPKVQKDLIRALAACGVEDGGVQKLVLEKIDPPAEGLMRVSAMLAAEHLKDRKKALDAADKALVQKDVAELRFAAGWLIARLHDSTRRAALESAAKSEPDVRVKPALELCLAVLDGKPIATLEPYLADLCASDIPRDR